MKNYWIDQDIDDRGICIDQQLVNNAIKCQKKSHDQYLQVSQKLTDLDNPSSPLQLKDWLNQRGVPTHSLSKATVAQLLQATTADTVHQVLGLRQLLSNPSVKKYQAMQKAMCQDGHVHGLLQFYGANRTGRWAGCCFCSFNPSALFKNLESRSFLLLTLANPLLLSDGVIRPIKY